MPPKTTKASVVNINIGKGAPKNSKKKAKKGKAKRMSKKGRTRYIRPGPGVLTAAAQATFKTSLLYPFSPDAVGTRVMDAVCYPTATYKVRTALSCTTTAQGTFGAIFLPFPTFNTVVRYGTMSGQTPYTQNTGCGYILTGTALAAQMSMYRVVSYGIRILLADTNTNSKGTFVLAPFMISNLIPSPYILENSPTTNITGLLGTSETTTSLRNMPAAVTFTTQDLLARGDVVVRGVPYLVTAYNMRNTQDSDTTYNAGKLFGDHSVLKTADHTVDLVGRSEIHSGNGWMGWRLYCDGMPANTNEFTVEYIAHLEGVPATASGLIPNSTPSPAGSTSATEAVISAIHKASDYVRQGASALEGVNRAVGMASVIYGRYGGRGRGNRIEYVD